MSFVHYHFIEDFENIQHDILECWSSILNM